jgi:hypothetical protein
MMTRRALLGMPVLACLGLAALAERPQLESRLGALRRRLATADPLAAQPSTWRQTPPPSSVLLTVEATSTHAINPLIYGLAHADPSSLDATGARLNRWGGNPNSRYNWVHGSAWNAARDWEFRNYGESADSPRGPSSVADTFVAANVASSAATWLTVPALGWVARDGQSDHRSTGVPSGGGPPSTVGSSAIIGYDPTANQAATSIRSLARKPKEPAATGDETVYQDEWMRHLVSRFGSATAGGVTFYSIDNEPDLWSTTHTDVHPVDPDYDEMLSVFVDYATAIKDVDPTAKVTGPALSGWTSLWFSARDRGDDNFASHADRMAHANQPFLEWWLSQIQQYEIQTGKHLLDVLDVHFYPQSAGVFGTLGDEATQRRRLRSTRALWDPTYTDESWIGEPMYLIPRLRAWRDQYAPDALLGIGEWNWGADDTLNGALAIANVLGIFGREGLDLACYWTRPQPGGPGQFAYRLFTDCDGRGRGFGDQSLPASSSAPDDVAVYASRDSSTNETIIVALNHRPDAAIPSMLSTPGTAEWYVYDAADLTRIRLMSTVESVGDSIRITLPPESLSLLRVSPR